MLTMSMFIVRGFSTAWRFFGIDQVPGSPIALDESPSIIHKDSVPRVPESVIIERHTRLIAGAFGITLDYDTMQTGVTATNTSSLVIPNSNQANKMLRHSSVTIEINEAVNETVRKQAIVDNVFTHEPALLTCKVA